MLFPDDPPPKLVGIARLAASSDVLEAKRQVEYLELETRRFIGRGSGRMSSIYTLNPYRGCEFGCKYCYARYAHEFMELRDSELFERKIYAKQFRSVAFRAELRRLRSGDTVWMGTATDPYQPAERRFNVSRQMLEAFADERGLDIGVTTKSDLVARDAPLMARIARKNRIRVHLTITTLDERLARLLEPRAPRPELRLGAVRTLSQAGIPVSVLAHPVMPLINDSEASLDGVCEAAVRNGATSFSAAPLFLKPCAAKVFLPFLEERFPHLVRRYRERFEKSAYLKGHYPEMIAERVEKIRARHKIADRHVPEWPSESFPDDQLELFSLYTAK
ncbi:MAG TPA: radical SAM protein [Bryobacteraceae bacterium]|nr:radical SAM protein [Bryobacteraceae bacterium]